MPPAGVLALQGDWEAHRRILLTLGAEVRTVRTAADLEAVGALVIPGGESTAMLRLMESEDLFRLLRERVAAGMAVLGTCAGVILLAETVEPPQASIGGLSVTAVRNAYGRQLDSMVAEVDLVADFGSPPMIEGVFIRAPRISRMGPKVEVLGRWRGDPVLVRQDLVLGATYHPELGADTRVHEMFLRMGEDVHG